MTLPESRARVRRWVPWSERLRSWAWRLRVPLALTWLLFLAAMAGFLWVYPRHIRSDVDLGLTIAARSLAYHATFHEVDRSRREIEEGKPELAEIRLETYLSRHTDVQPAQLHTHAVMDAMELLASLYQARNALGKAERTLVDATELSPLDWYPWFLLGDLRESRGDLPGATEALLRAFHLTGNHAGVANSTIDVLADLVRPQAVLEVADEFERARIRGAPQVDVKVGPPRPELQTRALDLVEIPVEHGAYQKSLRLWGLPRGPEASFELPGELFRGLPESGTFVQIRFENVYEDLRLLRVETVSRDRATAPAYAHTFGPGEVSTLHRAHSGEDWYLEFRLPMPTKTLEALRVHYSCPSEELSAECRTRVESARRSLAAKAGS